MKIGFGHHLSLSYNGGGEKWLIQLSNELVERGHEVEIHALPFLLDGKRKVKPEEQLVDGVTYTEKYHDSIKADVTYITYMPMNGIFFDVKSPKIAGIHSECYWQKLDRRYGLLPNMANFVNSLLGFKSLKSFDAVHMVTDKYSVPHNKVYKIPNFVNSEIYKPKCPKLETFTVGFASRKVWQKGYDVFNEVKHRCSDVNFVETDNIPESKMPDWYSANHITMVPSRVDTFGLTIVESLMCGTPVLSSGLYTHQALGLPLMFADSLSEYLNKIKYMKSLFGEYEYSGIASSCRAEALRYSQTHVINQLEDMLEEVSKV